jgi:hypothetical protein
MTCSRESLAGEKKENERERGFQSHTDALVIAIFLLAALPVKILQASESGERRNIYTHNPAWGT